MAHTRNLFPDDVLDVKSATITATTAGTTILCPSTATGAIYITGLVISNGATAGMISFGQGVAAVAPTTTAILMQPLFMAVTSNLSISFRQALKVSASNNFLVTATTSTTMSVTATYFVAP